MKKFMCAWMVVSAAMRAGVCEASGNDLPLDGIHAVEIDESSRTSADSPNAPDYLSLKTELVEEFSTVPPGRFSLPSSIRTESAGRVEKTMVLTFDACGGKSGGYNAGLIEFLRRSNVPATLFVTGTWIDENPEVFRDLARDPLFEIENHGLLHRPCSVDGRTKYGIAGTKDVGEVVDEIELNARKIERVTGRRPLFFRSATAFMDEASVKIAGRLGMASVGYDILSGDGEPFAPASTLRDNIVRNARDGAIVIMHFNHPEWNEEEALREALPLLRNQGYGFVKLNPDNSVAHEDRPFAELSAPGAPEPPTRGRGEGPDLLLIHDKFLEKNP